eukprot:gb/GFBE01007975.1/.p1 GENE.gb/GFBE01007975.1/~~gb/GFBE01007975.1/.p1  ORF type:complete len:126 (+),score=36.51 gb/GFBE01007975.1/:1-378(+)
MGESFLDQLCDEDGFRGQTWGDFLTSDQNNGGEFVELVRRKDKVYVGGMYGVAIEEACKHELSGANPQAVGQVIDLMEARAKGYDMKDIMKAAERTEEKTKKWLRKGKHKKLPVWQPESSGSSSD